MITAQEANSSYLNHEAHSLIPGIELAIKQACSECRTSVKYTISNSDLLDNVRNILFEHGYKVVCKNEGAGTLLEISWHKIPF
jgi:hypothetical protein